MTEPLVTAAPENRRKTERKSVSLPGKIILDGKEADCLVHDISPDGALIASDEALVVNRSIRLKVTANGEFLGLVVWGREGRYGLKFVQFEDDGMHLPPEAEAEAEAEPRAKQKPKIEVKPIPAKPKAEAQPKLVVRKVG